MKRNTKSFSVEIKKSRVQGQRPHLPPRRLFELTLVEATGIFQKEEPEAMAELPPAPRILPSIVEPLWGNSEPAEPVRRTHATMSVNREQMELDLKASAFEDVEETLSDVPVITEAVPQVDRATEQDAMSAHVVQPVQVELAKASARKPTRKASGVVEQLEYPQRAFDLEHPPEAELTLPSAPISPKAVKRGLTKRQAATIQLPRHERWKRRFHPASW